MTQPLTEQQLTDLEARATAATSGPWGVYTFGGDSLIEIAADLEDTGCGYSARRTIARLDEEPLDNDPTHTEWTAEEDWAQVQADAAFVAHAPEDVRALLAEVRRLRAELITNRADVLGEVAVELEGIDFHPNAKTTASDLCRLLAGRFRRKALDGLDAARATETHVVAEGAQR